MYGRLNTRDVIGVVQYVTNSKMHFLIRMGIFLEMIKFRQTTTAVVVVVVVEAGA